MYINEEKAEYVDDVDVDKVIPEEVGEGKEEVPPPPPTPKPKRKRAPTEYNKFVSKHMKTKKIQKLPPRERFAAISVLYKKHKAKKSKK